VPMSVPDINADIQMPSVLSAGDTALKCLNQYELLLKSCMKGACHRAACCNGPTCPLAGGLNLTPAHHHHTCSCGVTDTPCTPTQVPSAGTEHLAD
jgi:hypothetical protein